MLSGMLRIKARASNEHAIHNLGDGMDAKERCQSTSHVLWTTVTSANSTSFGWGSYPRYAQAHVHRFEARFSTSAVLDPLTRSAPTKPDGRNATLHGTFSLRPNLLGNRLVDSRTSATLCDQRSRNRPRSHRGRNPEKCRLDPGLRRDDGPAVMPFTRHWVRATARPSAGMAAGGAGARRERSPGQPAVSIFLVMGVPKPSSTTLRPASPPTTKILTCSTESTTWSRWSSGRSRIHRHCGVG